MHYLGCAALGYAMGSISPSYILGRVKKVDMRDSGTGNLGASNTFMHFGRFWGIFVMLFDIFKAFFAVKLSEFFFRELVFARLVSGAFSVLGHNYPFYLGFKGGKGLASFGGFIMGVSPILFCILLLLCLMLAFIWNYGCTIALSAAILFPVLAGIKYGSVTAFLISAVCSMSVFYKHTENIKRILSGEETKFRTFIGKYLIKIKKNKE